MFRTFVQRNKVFPSIHHHTKCVISTVIKPKVKGFICTTAHPAGCDSNVESQINFIKSQKNELKNDEKPKNVLVIGSSTGYGLAARITAAFGYDAKTIGVFFEKPASGKRTASAGWYNTAAFQKYAERDALYSKNINGNAFGHEIKDKTVEIIKSDLNEIDLVIYSLASARRQHPDTKVIHQSVLKPIGKSVTNSGLDTDKEIIKQFTLEPANEEEINNTVAVMGGDDWAMWINKLKDCNVLSPNAKTTAFTYLGSSVTSDIYWNGTIGAAKKDLDRVVKILNEQYGINASVSVLKAVITQASAAIPVMPLYLSLLFKIMKENGSHEGCIEQLYRLYKECLYNQTTARIDEDGRYRVDEKELLPNVQDEVDKLWQIANTDNFKSLSDFDGFKTGFLQLFGFNVDGVDYNKEVETEININNLYDENLK